MTFYEFVNEVEKQIRDYLPDSLKNAEIKLGEVSKLNDRYIGLTVNREDQIATPTVNLDMMYQKLNDGMELKEVLQNIAELSQSELDINNLSLIQNYETMKDHLFIRVSSAEANKEILDGVPHKIEGDLAITYHVLINSQDREVGSLMVTNQLIDTLGISKEQLHADALENSPKILPARIEPLVYVISRVFNQENHITPEGFDEQLKEITLGDGDMVVLSNQELVNGASAIFYPGLLDQIGDQVNGNFFILPSSTHETILIPDNGSFLLKDLENMVKEVNRTEVAPKDYLSDTVYHYDHESRKLEIAHTYEDRMAQKAQVVERIPERVSIKSQLKEAEKVCERQVPKPKAPGKETMLE